MSGWTFVHCGDQCSMTHSSICTLLSSEGVITVKFHLLKVDYELSPKGLPGCTVTWSAGATFMGGVVQRSWVTCSRLGGVILWRR